MIKITSHTPMDDARARLEAVLTEHAEQQGHGFVNESVNFEAWDDETFLGGLTARVGTDWIFVDLLALTEAARGQGIGRQLIAAIESLARDRKKTGIWLDTYSFQAPDFYRKMGFREVGRIDNYPKGEARLFFAKELAD